MGRFVDADALYLRAFADFPVPHKLDAMRAEGAAPPPFAIVRRGPQCEEVSLKEAMRTANAATDHWLADYGQRRRARRRLIITIAAVAIAAAIAIITIYS